ncbi:MAG: hypothetical protein NTZ69_07530 [Bacteroidia bacterium]|nr:hypothetical protein [Bacteroidia bacterium]
MEFEKFKSIVDSYFVAFGFVFGETVGNEVYYLSSESDTFKEFTQTIFLTKSENSFIESYPIFNSRIPSQGNIKFPKIVFENICSNYLNIEAYSRSINIVNEGLKAPSPLAKGVLFSSGLETISTAILSSKKPPKPINDENLKKGNLLKKLKDIIKEDSYLTEGEKEFLIEKKISSINNPTLIDKTIEAFNSNNIDLPAYLIKVTKYRNKYLHGSIPDEKKFGFLIDNLTRAFEMQFLVSILILKYSGYSGYVQNKSAILEYHAHMKNNSSKNIELKQAIYYKI